jgi:hypothetical protein
MFKLPSHTALSLPSHTALSHCPLTLLSLTARLTLLSHCPLTLLSLIALSHMRGCIQIQVGEAGIKCILFKSF